MLCHGYTQTTSRIGIMPRRLPEFDSGNAYACAAQLKKVGGFRRNQNSVAKGTGRSRLLRLFVYKYKITISYDGTHYPGWQIQPHVISIQEHIQNALGILLKKELVKVIGASRTDAGVHAHEQVAHFEVDSSLNEEKIVYSLNGILPPDIRILKIEPVSNIFHARFSALSKVYHYHLHLEKSMIPFQRNYCYHVRKKIDLQLLQKAATLFLGTHDFTSFANEANKGSAKNKPIKTLKRLDIIEQKGGVRLEFEADGFLYKMVRTIVGTLLEIASGSLTIEEIETIFQAKDRKKAGPAAPPQGLFLTSINYEKNQTLIEELLLHGPDSGIAARLV